MKRLIVRYWLLALGIIPLPATQTATIFKSGTLGPTGLAQSSVAATSITPFVFPGVRFQLAQPELTSQEGGSLVARDNGTFLGAMSFESSDANIPESTSLILFLIVSISATVRRRDIILQWAGRAQSKLRAIFFSCINPAMRCAVYATTVAIGCCYATTAIGAVVFSQTTPAEPGGALGSSDSPISQKVADNFSLNGTNSTNIRSLRFIGSLGMSDPLSDAFRVVFLEDAGGSPGQPLSGGDFDIGPAFSRTPTGGQLLGGVSPPAEYVINLPRAMTVSPNTPYWISITNDLLPASGWVWARADWVFDPTLATTTGSISSGPWSAFPSSGMWFELSDQIVPEPDSLVILLVALLTATVPRRDIIFQWAGRAQSKLRAIFFSCINPAMRCAVYATTLAIGCCYATTAIGAVVYSQTTPAEPGGAFSSQDETSGQAIADNFVLNGTEPVTVRSVRLIGARTGAAPPLPEDNFRVVFFADAGGIPGNILPGGDFNEGNFSTKTTTGGLLLNGVYPPIEYSIDLGEGMTLNPNTDYWMAITNDPAPSIGWAWAKANSPFDNIMAATSDSFDNPSWIAGSGGMWFELSSTNVPEPSSLVLFLMVLSASQLARNHKHERHYCSI